jgi:hypothetical protein
VTLVTILNIAQETMRLIHSNFRVAVGVNTAILAGAASGRLAPLTAATLHNGATIAVLLRALLSRWSARVKIEACAGRPRTRLSAKQQAGNATRCGAGEHAE